MKDTGYDHAHSSPIKTPQQLVVIIVLAFALPVLAILMLAHFIVSDKTTDAATLAPDAVAARIRPVARVEFAGAAPAQTAAAPGPVAAAPAAAPATPEQLLQKNGCLACHAIDHKVIGPAYKDVAAKFGADKNALAMLVGKVKGGSVGVWGQIPMPPHPQISDADLQSMVKYILAQK